MASKEHSKLADFLKSVHKSLRERSAEIGAEGAWFEHCAMDELMEKYAATMRTLALEHWEENAKDTDKEARSRIRWVTDKCVEYFMQDQETEDIIEKNALQKLEPSDESACGNWKTFGNFKDLIFGNPEDVNIDLLDVGSCYNPFGKYAMFKVLPIDLKPATEDVYQCDFLKVDIRPKGSLKGTLDHHSITELEEESFDVVVFSLLLEYLPSPKQRYACVTKAYKLLKPAGVLFIITPDSKHATANAPLMKSWRILLGDLGFSRVYYEKLPHIHCMAYRKCRIPKVAKQWALRARQKQGEQSFMATHGISQGLYIPQDLQKHVPQDKQDKHDESDVQNPIERTSLENEELVKMFQHLPEGNI